MTSTISDFISTVEHLEKHRPELVLEKAKEAYNYCFFNKGSKAHLQSKKTKTKDIKGFRDKHNKFIDVIFHKDSSITLVTADKYYLRFYNI